MNQLTATDAAYIAGLFDGEGSIGFRRVHSSDGHTPGCVLRIRITNTHSEVLRWVACVVGAPNKVFKRKPGKAHYLPYYEWSVSSQNALSLLHQIYPYLRIKRLQAEVAFRYEQSPASGSFRGNQYRRVPQEVAELREQFKQELHEVNRTYCGADASALGPQGPNR